jgi:hypothetical protein
MKWPPFLSTFVLNKMCELIKSSIGTENGFKEVHLTNVAKKVSGCTTTCVSGEESGLRYRSRETLVVPARMMTLTPFS